MIARPEFNVLPCAFKIYVWRHVNFYFTLFHSCNWPTSKISYLLRPQMEMSGLHRGCALKRFLMHELAKFLEVYYTVLVV